MTDDVFFLRFLWGPRQEALGQCVNRLNRYLTELKAIDSSFDAWQKGSTKGKQFQVPLDPKQLQKWLSEGVNRTDIGKEAIPELGYATSIACNAEESIITLRINCGAYSPWTKNTCSIEFPVDGRTADRLLQVEPLIRIAKSTIDNWEPDQGVITSHQCSELSSPKTFLSEAGWVTYLSGKYNHLSQTPKQLRTENVGDGRLLIATMERFSSKNSDHVKSVLALSSALNSDN